MKKSTTLLKKALFALCLTLGMNGMMAQIPCSINLAYISNNPSVPCGDSAMVTAVGNWCTPVTFTWSNGATGPLVGGLCGNTTYTVYASAPGGTNCCTSGITTITVPGSTCNINAGFTMTQGANGVVNFANTTTGASPGFYYWQFGDNTTSVQNSPAHTYAANGIYTIILTAMNSSVIPTCTSVAIQTIAITSSTNNCNLNANFNYTQGSNGTVNFNNTSSGTSGSTTYNWSFGDNSSNSTSNSPVHTYSANGQYVVTMTANNNTTPSCVDTQTMMVWVSSYCNLAAGFNYVTGANGSVAFNNTTTGTNPPFTAYQWNFGDANNSTLTNPTHVYTSNGTYTVVLTAFNYSSAVPCGDTISQVITITNASNCNMVAGFTATPLGNNMVSFMNTSAGTNANTIYNWSFGDGNFSNVQSPTHTYAGSGVYTAVLFISDTTGLCSDSIVQTFSVTGTPCTANSNFSLAPSGTPQVWNAAPSFPWNVVAAEWTWGDGSTSNVLYTSHTYSAAGLYSICLSVTVSCNAVSSTCTSYSIYRTTQDMSMVKINVVDPGTFTGISANGEASEAVYSIQPNPSNGNFNLSISGLKFGTADISVYNLVGDLIYSGSSDIANGSLTKNISLDNAATGVYLVKINADNKVITKKVIVNKQ